jgi:hypothetical protein
VADSDGTRAHRVASLAEAALAQVETTRRAVAELLAEIGTPRPAPAVAQEGGLDSARLVAIEMAVAGRSRDEVGHHLRATYDAGDLEALLDDVFGPPGDEGPQVGLKPRKGTSP